MCGGELASTFTDAVTAKSDYVVARIVDHTGVSYVGSGSGCDVSQATQVLSSDVAVAPGKVWRVDVGACPGYTTSFVQASSKARMVWAYVAVVVVGAALAAGIAIVALRVSNKEAALQLARATHAESNRAHRWIIGYGAWGVLVYKRMGGVVGWGWPSLGCSGRPMGRSETG